MPSATSRVTSSVRGTSIAPRVRKADRGPRTCPHQIHLRPQCSESCSKGRAGLSRANIRYYLVRIICAPVRRVRRCAGSARRRALSPGPLAAPGCMRATGPGPPSSGASAPRVPASEMRHAAHSCTINTQEESSSILQSLRHLSVVSVLWYLGASMVENRPSMIHMTAAHLTNELLSPSVCLVRSERALWEGAEASSRNSSPTRNCWCARGSTTPPSGKSTSSAFMRDSSAALLFPSVRTLSCASIDEAPTAATR